MLGTNVKRTRSLAHLLCSLLAGGVANILGTIQNSVSSLGLDEAWWTNITAAAMICLFLVIQSVVLLRKNKRKQ